MASALPVVLLQFLIEPLMARHMMEETFGLMITIVSLFTMLAGVFGNSLNNVLLLKHKEIDNGRRDYNILFVIFEGTSFIALLLVSIFIYKVTDPKTIIMIGVIGLCSTFFAYCSAQFRMDFKYYLYLFCELGKCAGYGLGYFIFRLTGDWAYVFLIGLVFEMIVCLIFTNVWRYPYKTSKHFKTITFAALFVLGSALTASLVTYFDKLLLYPIMGGDSVSIYNTATIIAKGLSLITSPLGAVLLGYLVKRKFLTIKQLFILLIVFTAAVAPLFFIFYFAAKWILPFMYPDFYEDAMDLLIFTTLFAIIDIYVALCQPILLTHKGERVSLFYGIAKAVISILFGLIGIWVDGLLGFCIFRFVSLIIIFIILFVLLLLKSRRIYRNGVPNEEEKKEEETSTESNEAETPSDEYTNEVIESIKETN